MGELVLCVVAFIFSDAARNLVNAWAIADTPIVQQSVVWTMSASSIPIGILMSAVLDGREGDLESSLLPLSSRVWASLLWCVPVAACFSIGQTLQMKAYGAGISASVNTVLGYFYMPMSALLSRWDEGAKKASAENVAGIIPREAQKPGLWPDVFHETDEEYVLVASTHHVRLKICEALLNKGYIQNNGGKLVRVSLHDNAQWTPAHNLIQCFS
eukprot:s1839_g2.t1